MTIMNSQAIHPVVAQKILDGNVDRQLYRIVFIAKVYPDDGDLSTVGLARYMVHLFAVDARDAQDRIIKDWERNMGDNTELMLLLAVAPAPGESIEEGSMWQEPIMRVVGH